MSGYVSILPYLMATDRHVLLIGEVILITSWSGEGNIHPVKGKSGVQCHAKPVSWERWE